MLATRVTPDELDTAILAVLTDFGGRVLAWPKLRDLLPVSTYWDRVQALVRLEQSGRVDVVKINGRNYVSLPMTIGRRRAA